MFEVTALVKLLLWPLAFVAGCYVLALRPWRPRVLLQSLSPSIDLFFLAVLGVATLAVMEPLPFESAAGLLVEQTSLPDGLAAIDIQIAELEDAPERMWAEFKAQLGLDEPPLAESASWPERPGPVESTIVAAVAEIISMTLRAYTYLAGLTALWMALVMRLFIRSAAARRIAQEMLG